MSLPLQGIIIPTITALDDKGKFDSGSQECLIRYLCDNNVDAIFALGLTGEAYSLDCKTKKTVMAVSADAIKQINKDFKSVALVIGVTGQNLEETCEYAKYAAALQPDGLVVQPSAIAADYLEVITGIISTTDLPIYLYSNPQTARHGTEILSPRVVAELAQISQVKGLKASVQLSELKQYASVLAETEFRLYAGNATDIFTASADDDISPLLTGVVTGPGNVYPRDWVNAWDIRRPDADDAFKENLNTFFSDFNRCCITMPEGNDTIAAIKYFLYKKSIIASPRTAKGNLISSDKRHLDEQYSKIESSLY